MAARAGIGFAAPDSGFAAADDVAAVQKTCDSFDETVTWDLAARWIALLPCRFTTVIQACKARLTKRRR